MMQVLPEAIKNFVGKKSLADRFDEVLEKLDQTIIETIKALEKHTQRAQDDTARRDLEGAVRRLDDFVFQLRI